MRNVRLESALRGTAMLIGWGVGYHSAQIHASPLALGGVVVGLVVGQYLWGMFTKEE